MGDRTDAKLSVLDYYYPHVTNINNAFRHYQDAMYLKSLGGGGMKYGITSSAEKVPCGAYMPPLTDADKASKHADKLRSVLSSTQAVVGAANSLDDVEVRNVASSGSCVHISGTVKVEDVSGLTQREIEEREAWKAANASQDPALDDDVKAAHEALRVSVKAALEKCAADLATAVKASSARFESRFAPTTTTAA